MKEPNALAISRHALDSDVLGNPCLMREVVGRRKKSRGTDLILHEEVKSPGPVRFGRILGAIMN